MPGVTPLPPVQWALLTPNNHGKEFIMGAKKILMLVGDFVEDYEVMVPFQIGRAHV